MTLKGAKRVKITAILVIIKIFCNLISVIVYLLVKSTLCVLNYCDLIFESQWLLAKCAKKHTKYLVPYIF